MTIDNVSRYVTHWAQRDPDHEAIVAGDRRLSYAAFEQELARLAGGLTALGLRRGDRVAAQMPTCVEYLLLYMAVARIGGILVGINAAYTAAETTYLLEVSRPRLLVGHSSLAGQLDEARRKSPVEHVFAVGDPAAGWRPWSELGALDDGTREWTTDADDPILIVFTSGTTGRPKGAVLSHANVIANIEAQVRAFAMKRSDRAVLHLPMNHVAGATELTVGALMAGATLLVLERFHPQTTLELVSRERATFLGQVPAMFIMELSLPDLARHDLSSLTRLVVAGAPLPPGLGEQMRRIAPVITGYGMTELAGFVTYTSLDDDLETISRTVGRMTDEFELRVVDAQRQDVSAGEVGEVAVRGACVMLGYYGDEAATQEVLDDDGWFFTGDMGRLDPEGRLCLVGRKKEMYITGGYNVYPPEVEDAIAAHPGVALAACVGTPDAVLGEVGRAYVVPRPGTSLSSAELHAFLAQRLADYKLPKHYTIREKLPLTALGKVDKKLLK